MPKKILVSDTNIWIDLYHSHLLEKVFDLPYQFVTTEFVWQELRKPPGQHLTHLGLAIEVLDSHEMGCPSNKLDTHLVAERVTGGVHE